jgi:hypothetical protein
MPYRSRVAEPTRPPPSGCRPSGGAPPRERELHGARVRVTEESTTERATPDEELEVAPDESNPRSRRTAG